MEMATETEIEKKYLSIKEASKYTGIPVATLYRRVKEIGAFKPTNKLVFTYEMLDRWIKRHPAA